MSKIMIVIAIVALYVSQALAAPVSLHHYYAAHHGKTTGASKKGH
jgi:hypothetical protein